MTYFSNGAEFDMWERDNCQVCLHRPTAEKDCPIIALHWAWNYDQHAPGKTDCEESRRAELVHEFLQRLIPDDGIYPGQCNMLIKREERP